MSPDPAANPAADDLVVHFMWDCDLDCPRRLTRQFALRLENRRWNVAAAGEVTKLASQDVLGNVRCFTSKPAARAAGPITASDSAGAMKPTWSSSEMRLRIVRIRCGSASTVVRNFSAEVVARKRAAPRNEAATRSLSASSRVS